MKIERLTTLLNEWSIDVDDYLENSHSICIALFTSTKELLFVNDLLQSILTENLFDSFLNPSYNDLLGLPTTALLVFEGHLTLGHYDMVNPSIYAKIYRKKQHFLLLGNVDAAQLLVQNGKVHHLNTEIINLQRKLLKQNQQLEYTLAQLNNSNQELKRLNADKDRFMQILAHDLRGPLGAILGLSELLCSRYKGMDAERLGKRLFALYDTSKSTFAFLEDLLLWSKAQAGKINFLPEPVPVHSLVENAIAPFLNNNKRIQVAIDFLPHTDVMADKNMVQTVLRNLVSNAIKFSDLDSEVMIQGAVKKNKLVVSVVDFGVGMSAEAVNSIWDFTYAETTRGTLGEKGSGFGLQLCKEFIGCHNEEIWVESKPAQGSTFSFTLPVCG